LKKNDEHEIHESPPSPGRKIGEPGKGGPWMIMDSRMEKG
jgi:hypothetical protein